MYAATPPFEALKLLTAKLAARERERRHTKIAPGDDNSSVMTLVDVHRAYFYAEAKLNTHVEVPIRMNFREAKCVLGQGEERNEASGVGVQEAVEKAMRGVNMNLGAS